MPQERLQKILAHAGVASRRAAELLIREGRVSVNGKVMTELGSKADPEKDHVKVDGKLLRAARRPVWFLFHKPRRVVSTLSDPEGRPSLKEYLTKIHERVYPVGRLDFESEGLILLTNDGGLTARLMHPSGGIEKVYHVKTKGELDAAAMEKMLRGVRCQGEMLRAEKVRPLKRLDKNAWYEIVLREGRNRHIRRMLAALEHDALTLLRVAYGPLKLDVPPGMMRPLSEREVESLRRAVRPSSPRPAPPRRR